MFLAWSIAIFPTLVVAADFDPGDPSWNGLSELMTVAADLGIQVETPDRVELWTLAANDALLIVHPTTSPPASSLSGFMRAGGRVAIADDFGDGGQLLQSFEIGRHAPRAAQRDRRLMMRIRRRLAAHEARHLPNLRRMYAEVAS